MAVSFDCFGTLVEADRPSDPAAAIAEELRERGVPVPDDWDRVYRERHVDAPDGAVVPLPAHVAAALSSRGVEAPGNAARRAVVAAFDPQVRVREGARRAVRAARERGPVGVCSNCAVPGLVRKTLIRAETTGDDGAGGGDAGDDAGHDGARAAAPDGSLAPDAFDAVVTSVACGWRKPDRRIFETTADRLNVAPGDLTHVGDDARTDGGVADLGGRFVSVEDGPLTAVPTMLADDREGAGDASEREGR